VAKAIDEAPATERPVIGRKLTDVLPSGVHLNPLGEPEKFAECSR
jgi:hypothetical protein